MKILGLHTMLHDTGASAIIDGKVNSILEARLSRVKHSGAFPHLSIRYIMDMHNIRDINEFDVIAVDHLLRNKKHAAEEGIRETGFRGEIQFIGHHDAHAASAFFCSPFDEAAVLIVDGQGSSAHESSHDRKAAADEASTEDAHELQSYYYGKSNTLKVVHKTFSSDKHRHGIGDFYAAVTRYLNFGVDHGKVMGLSAYGGHSDWCKNIVIESHAGDFYLNAPAWAYYPDDIGRRYFNGKKPRTTEPPLDDFWTDVAYAAQHNCEYALVEMAKHLHRITGCKNICLAGGVALNSVANQRILDETPFEQIFIQPAASDEGISLGAALYAYHQIAGKNRFYEMRDAYLGKPYSDPDIEAALENKKHLVHVRRSNNLYRETAALLQNKEIVGWFQGASEIGPRALGHRSLLCDPRSVELRNYLNACIKKREAFRPFAPSVLADHYKDHFHLTCASPFMLLIARVAEGVQEKFPAITHVDGTARIQTVTDRENPRFYRLISAFYELTGVPMLLNTSFNVAGEPMVESPVDALNCFLGTPISVLVMHDYIITKRGNTADKP